MKAYLTLLFLSFSLILIAQERVTIDGKISVPENGNAEGITVFNESSDIGVVTDVYGKFKIDVANNETLNFSSIQYQEFSVIIDAGVIENKQLTVYVRETVNTLDEVIVRPYDLSGNAQVDVGYIDVSPGAVFDVNSKAQVETFDYEFTPDRFTKVDNVSIDKGYLTNGLNFGNIFRSLVNNKDKAANENNETPFNMDVAVRKVYNDSFFNTYLNIERDRINQFIFYAESNGLTKDLLKKENELDLIEFLIESSKSFKAEREKK